MTRSSDAQERRRTAGRRLTDRQTAILELVASGLENKEIAHELGISEQAVKEQVSTLLRVLAAPNRAALGDAAATRRFLGGATIDPEWLRYLFQDAPMHVAIVEGPEHRFVAINDALRFTTGGADVIGKPYREAFAGRAESLAFLDRAYRTGERVVTSSPRRLFVRAGRSEPEDGYVTFVLQPLPGADGGIGGLAIFSIDVTTDIPHMTQALTRSALRIQTADEEIRAERDRLDLVLKSVPNPIIVVDNDNQIINLNSAAQRLFTPREGTQNALANDAKFTSFLSQFRLDPATTTRAEITLAEPGSGERLEMEITATEVRDSHGAVVAIVSAMQEVGRLRELERRRLQQVLFETEKLAATGRLAASIAHEINNPLEAVQNSLYLLGGAVKSDAAEYKYLEIARNETQRMSRILRQMLSFYRPGTDLAPIDVNAIVDDAETLVAKRLRQSKVALVRDLDPDLPKIRASADQIKQVLLNLFLNAAEAMPDGGKLTVTTHHAAANERELPFDSIRIEVRDTGLGIDEETQARIFEAFFSTKTQKGTGLGLWVSHGIVQGHGGTMKVRSRLGEGTTFIIALPVAGPPERP